MKVVAIMSRIEERIVRLITWVSAVCLSVICLVMLLQVFMRRMLNTPLVWAEDLTVFLFIWITFLGAAVLFSRKSMISVDSFVMLFSRKVRLVLEAVVEITVFAAAWYLLHLSVLFMQRQRLLGHKLGGALGIPSWIITVAIITSFIVMLFSSITAVLKKIVNHTNTKGSE
jgi:C4-dicarboxylate transporter DctQ subunit